MMVSPLSTLSSNFFFLLVGIAFTLFVSLKSGSVEEQWRGTFWVGLYASLILTLFFGIFAGAQEYRKHKFRKEFKGRAREIN